MIVTQSEIPETGSQQAHSLKTMLYKRQCDFMTDIDVDTTLFRRHLHTSVSRFFQMGRYLMYLFFTSLLVVLLHCTTEGYKVKDCVRACGPDYTWWLYREICKQCANDPAFKGRFCKFACSKSHWFYKSICKSCSW